MGVGAIRRLYGGCTRGSMGFFGDCRGAYRIWGGSGIRVVEVCGPVELFRFLGVRVLGLILRVSDLGLKVS